MLLAQISLSLYFSIEKEIDYVKLLNGTLPNGIRALAWSPVEPESSARFDCTARIYRYYLPK